MIQIEISGAAGTGKTMLLNGIGAYLKEKGFNVACKDGFCSINPRSALHKSPDQRWIIIKTKLEEK